MISYVGKVGEENTWGSFDPLGPRLEVTLTSPLERGDAVLIAVVAPVYGSNSLVFHFDDGRDSLGGTGYQELAELPNFNAGCSAFILGGTVPQDLPAGATISLRWRTVYFGVPDPPDYPGSADRSIATAHAFRSDTGFAGAGVPIVAGVDYDPGGYVQTCTPAAALADTLDPIFGIRGEAYFSLVNATMPYWGSGGGTPPTWPEFDHWKAGYTTVDTYDTREWLAFGFQQDAIAVGYKLGHVDSHDPGGCWDAGSPYHDVLAATVRPLDSPDIPGWAQVGEGAGGIRRLGTRRKPSVD